MGQGDRETTIMVPSDTHLLGEYTEHYCLRRRLDQTQKSFRYYNVGKGLCQRKVNKLISLWKRADAIRQENNSFFQGLKEGESFMPDLRNGARP